MTAMAPGISGQPSVSEPLGGPPGAEPAAASDGGDGTGISGQPSVSEPRRASLDTSVMPFGSRLREVMSRGREQGGADLPPVSAGEFMKATASSTPLASRRPSTLLGPIASETSFLGPAGRAELASRTVTGDVPEDVSLGTKRQAEVDTEELRSTQAAPGGDRVPFDALTLERKEILAAATADQGEVHPLVRLQAEVALDRDKGVSMEARDHGSWDGRWPLPSRSQYEAFVEAGMRWPCSHDAFVVQAARKEYHWRTMTPEQKAAFRVAADEAWSVWVRNDAVECGSS